MCTIMVKRSNIHAAIVKLTCIIIADYRVLLGELQLSFVCLLMAQNFSGFNQWKKLVHLLCSCSELMTEKPDLFIEFMG